MRKFFLISSLSGALLAAPVIFVSAQGPGGPGGGPGGGRGLSKAADVEDLVTRMMAFDQDKDGKLTRAELTDSRLAGLFARADVDKDGTITKNDLTALAEKEYVGGRGGFGGPGGGPGGPGGFGGPGGGPMGTPGVVLAPMLQQRLGLTNDQKAQLAQLQAEVDTKLEKILTKEQRSQLQQMRERGPGGPGGGGPGGPGGPGGGRRGGPGGPGGPGGGGPGGPGGGPPGE